MRDLQRERDKENKMDKCYPFDLCYSKCRFSTDKIKQGDLVFNVYYLWKWGVIFTEL